MSELRHFDDPAEAAVLGGPLHVAIGMFDGVHLGHVAVIDAAVQSARRSGGVAAVLTFFPHPSRLFRPDAPTRLIMPPAAKRQRLLALGVDAIVEQPFTPDYAAVEAEDFLPRLRTKLPRLAAVYVGENWRFGRGRRGDADLLIAAGRQLGITVFSAERVRLNGEPISSTRIRAHLEAGAIAAANELLGTSYTAEGVVAPGRQLGRTLGFPTLNVPWDPELPPRFGVYAVRIRAADTPPAAGAPAAPAVANFGVRPTVEAEPPAPRLEVHVLGATALTTGDRVHVEWLHFLRPEQRFADLPALRAQIARDRAAAEDWFRT